MPLTIGELSQATGVPIATLRDWDRRHGLSPSRRTLGNHRRYSRADAELVIAVRDLVAEGMRLRESVQRVRSAQPQRRSPTTATPVATGAELAAIAADQQRLRDNAAATRAAFVAKRDELIAEREALIARRHSLVRAHGETVAGLVDAAADILSPTGGTADAEIQR